MVSPVPTANVSTCSNNSPLSKKIRKYTKKLEAITKIKQKDPSTLREEQLAAIASEKDIRLILDELIAISKEENAVSQASVSTEEPTPRDTPVTKEKASQLYSLAYILSFALDEDFKERLTSRGVTREQIQALSNLEHQTAHITLSDFSSRTDDLLNLDDMVAQLEKNEVTGKTETTATTTTSGVSEPTIPVNTTPKGKGKGKGNGKGGKGKGAKGKGNGKGRKEDAKN